MRSSSSTQQPVSTSVWRGLIEHSEFNLVSVLVSGVASLKALRILIPLTCIWPLNPLIQEGILADCIPRRVSKHLLID